MNIIKNIMCIGSGLCILSLQASDRLTSAEIAAAKAQRKLQQQQTKADAYEQYLAQLQPPSAKLKSVAQNKHSTVIGSSASSSAAPNSSSAAKCVQELEAEWNKQDQYRMNTLSQIAFVRQTFGACNSDGFVAILGLTATYDHIIQTMQRIQGEWKKLKGVK